MRWTSKKKEGEIKGHLRRLVRRNVLGGTRNKASELMPYTEKVGGQLTNARVQTTFTLYFQWHFRKKRKKIFYSRWKSSIPRERTQQSNAGRILCILLLEFRC